VHGASIKSPRKGEASMQYIGLVFLSSFFLSFFVYFCVLLLLPSFSWFLLTLSQ
jgi:hypothetical protein